MKKQPGGTPGSTPDGWYPGVYEDWEPSLDEQHDAADKRIEELWKEVKINLSLKDKMKLEERLLKALWVKENPF